MKSSEVRIAGDQSKDVKSKVESSNNKAHLGASFLQSLLASSELFLLSKKEARYQAPFIDDSSLKCRVMKRRRVVPLIEEKWPLGKEGFKILPL